MTKIRLLVAATAGILATLAVTGAAEAFPCYWWIDYFGYYHTYCY
jgi:hypothetical protein